MKTLFFSLILATGAMAQSPLPKDFIAAGAAMADGKASEFASYGHCGLLNPDLCSFSTVNATSVRLFYNGKFTPTVQTAVRTGVAYRLKSFGKVQLFALGDAGAAQAIADGTSIVGSSFSGGGFAAIPIGKHWGAFLGARIEKTLATPTTVYEAGAVYRIQ